MNEQFVWSDAWILLAVIYSGRRTGQKVDIASIYEAADHINHAVPTQEEWAGALARLQGAGFVEEEDGLFRASASTLQAYAGTTTPRRDVYKELEDIKRLLGVETSSSGV